MVLAAADGVVARSEAEACAAFRKANGISQAQHEEALQLAGWEGKPFGEPAARGGRLTAALSWPWRRRKPADLEPPEPEPEPRMLRRGSKLRDRRLEPM